MSTLLKIFQVFALAAVLSAPASAFAQTDEDKSARGIVDTIARAEIGTEIIAIIDEMPFRDGDAFEKGDILVHLNCGKYEAEQRSAAAFKQAREVELRTKEFLRSKKSIGQAEVDVAHAQLAEAEAKSDAATFQADQCQIRAPFAGKVVETFRNQHELTKPSEPLISIIDDQTLEISLIVPSTWLEWLDIGTQFRFNIDETGADVIGEVFRLGAEVDAVSQTLKITGLFTADPQNVLPGMSGTAHF